VATKKNQQEPSIKHTIRLNLERSQSSQACTVLLLFLADLLVALEVNAALPINDKIQKANAREYKCSTRSAVAVRDKPNNKHRTTETPVATKKNQQEPSIKHTIRLNLERSRSSQACTVLLLFLEDLLVALEANTAHAHQ